MMVGISTTEFTDGVVDDEELVVDKEGIVTPGVLFVEDGFVVVEDGEVVVEDGEVELVVVEAEGGLPRVIRKSASGCLPGYIPLVWRF